MCILITEILQRTVLSVITAYHVRQRLHEVNAFSKDLYEGVNVT